MELSFTDRTYMVTGGGSGIGKGVAAGLVQSGAKVMILGRDAQPAAMAVRFLRSLLSLVAVFSPPVMLMALFHPWGDGPAEMLSGASVVSEEDLKAFLEAGRPGDWVD